MTEETFFDRVLQEVLESIESQGGDIQPTSLDSIVIVGIPLLLLSSFVHFVIMPNILWAYDFTRNAISSYKKAEYAEPQGYGDSKSYIVSHANDNASTILQLQNHPNTKTRHTSPKTTQYISDVALSTLAIIRNIQEEQTAKTITPFTTLNIFTLAKKSISYPITKAKNFLYWSAERMPKKVSIPLAVASITALSLTLYHYGLYYIQQIDTLTLDQVGWFTYNTLRNIAAALVIQDVITLLLMPAREIFTSVKDAIKTYQEPLDPRMETLQDNNDIMESYLHILLYNTQPLEAEETHNSTSNDSLSHTEKSALSWLETLTWINSITPNKSQNQIPTAKSEDSTPYQILSTYRCMMHKKPNMDNNHTNPEVQEPSNRNTPIKKEDKQQSPTQHNTTLKPNTTMHDSNAKNIQPEAHISV